MDQKLKRDKTERLGLKVDLRTREGIENRNQVTALRFQTGGRHQTSLASILEGREVNDKKERMIIFGYLFKTIHEGGQENEKGDWWQH